ncbi:MAG: CapA family protein [Bacteroidales bacterium]|nr:CapA family protein [Bacteroidales bacterium]
MKYHSGRFALFLLLTTGIPGICFAQHNDTSFLKISFAGDIMGHDGQIAGAYIDSTGEYDYEPTFRYIKPYLQSVDIALANLEVTLAGPPYKGYPQFSSPDNLAAEANKAGFQVLVTANNHSLDRGVKGFTRTIEVLDSFNIIHTGTFKSEQARIIDYPLLIEKNNILLAVLNYTYGTNGLTIKPPYIVNRIDTAQIRTDLEKARLANPDFIFVTIHWGTEYVRNENREQQRLAEFMIKKGADAVIGSHPHVVQPVKLYYPDKSDSTKFNIIVYSLGNFVSNQRAQYKDGGIIFEVSLTKTNGYTSVSDYNYMPVWVYRKDKNQKSTFYILPVDFYNSNSSFFNLTDHDKYKINLFYNDTRQHLQNIPENRFYSNYLLPAE